MQLNAAKTHRISWNQYVKHGLRSITLGIILSFFVHPAGAETPSETPAVLTPLSSEPATHFVEFILEDEANCQSRDSQHVIVRNTHPTKTVRVWLDRYYRNVPTGDRSRTDLLPGAEPEGLGCATVMNAKQEWRVVRALFID